MKRKRRKKKGWLEKKLGNSVINYFSDLFIVSVVISWIVVMLVMLFMGIYSTVVNQDNSIWSDLQCLCGIPLSCGISVWLVKCAVCQAISRQQGKRAPMDFPKVDEVEEIEKEDGNLYIDENENDNDGACEEDEESTDEIDISEEDDTNDK